MARQCTICASEQRESIEQALLDSIPEVRIAERYGVSRSAVARHRQNHLGPALWRAMERREDLNADALVARMDGLHLRLVAYEVQAARARDWQAVRGLASEQRQTSELIARLRGDLDGPTVNIDARRQLAVLGSLSEDDLRALAAADADESLALPETVPADVEPVPVG